MHLAVIYLQHTMEPLRPPCHPMFTTAVVHLCSTTPDNGAQAVLRCLRRLAQAPLTKEIVGDTAATRKLERVADDLAAMLGEAHDRGPAAMAALVLPQGERARPEACEVCQRVRPWRFRSRQTPALAAAHFAKLTS